MTPQTEVAEKGEKQDKKLKVTVFAPRTPKPKQFNWLPTMLVGDAAKDAADKFKYSEGTPGLSKDQQVLDNGQTLEVAGVKDGDELTLVDVGGGV
jgi:hypothetical protein